MAYRNTTASARPNDEDRESPAFAEQVLVQLFADPGVRSVCTEFIAASISLAHSCDSAHWGITLFPDAVRLNVGQIEVLTFVHGTIHVLVDAESIPPGLAQRSDVVTTTPPLYRSVPTSIGCDFPAHIAAVVLPLIRESHERLVRHAASGPLNPAARSAYSPGVTAYLGALTPLQHPSYYESASKPTLTQRAMATYLIKSNPKKHPWADLEQAVEQVRRRGFYETGWSCGNTKRIRRGDRVFLQRTGIAPRGIVASGFVTEEPYEDDHYDAARGGASALYVGVRFDALVHPDHEGILTIGQLKSEHLAKFPWHTQGSGITIPPPAAAELEAAWTAFLTAHGQQPICLADEVMTPARFFEGATRQIAVNIYERNAHARQRCVEHYGCRCSVCGFDFEKVYGKLGSSFIHVHHLKPLSEIQEEYEIDPIADLRPICPNCHAMIHRGTEMMSIEELKELIRNCVTSA